MSKFKEDEFEVGDRVRAIGVVANRDMTNKFGTIKAINKSGCHDINVEFDEKFSGGHTGDGDCKFGHGRHCASSEFELVSPKEKLIGTNMDINDIKEFPKAVLVKAEKKAKEELAEEQENIAVAKFKELLGQIEVAERDVKKANKRLTELRGMAKITKK